MSKILYILVISNHVFKLESARICKFCRGRSKMGNWQACFINEYYSNKLSDEKRVDCSAPTLDRDGRHESVDEMTPSDAFSQVERR